MDQVNDYEPAEEADSRRSYSVLGLAFLGSCAVWVVVVVAGLKVWRALGP
jgi:hypothetical protein